MSVEGILIKELQNDVPVPDGATSWKKDQYCASPGSVQYVSITFQTDGLLDALHQQLDALGYTKKLHAALRELQQHLEERTTQDELGAMINNKIVAVAKLVKLEINEDDNTSPGAVVAHARGSPIIQDRFVSMVPETPERNQSLQPAPISPAGCDQGHGAEQTAQSGELDTASFADSEPLPTIWSPGVADAWWWQAGGTEPWSSGAASSSTGWYQ
jgi:hypothetical protein